MLNFKAEQPITKLFTSLQILYLCYSMNCLTWIAVIKHLLYMSKL